MGKFGDTPLTFENIWTCILGHTTKFEFGFLHNIRFEKKFWKIEHANDLYVHGYFSASRRSILMRFSMICSLVLSRQVKNSIWRFGVIYYWLSACKLSENFYDIIWPLCSNTHADPMLYEKWSKRCRGATHEKYVLKTWNNFSLNPSSWKDL